MDGSNLDFDEEDYIESESEKGSDDEINKKAKTITKEELLNLMKKSLSGNKYYITKIIRIFNKINKVETIDENHVLNIPKYTNKLIKFFIKDLPDILIMKLKDASKLYNKKKSIPNSLKANEFMLENDSEQEEDMVIDNNLNNQLADTDANTKNLIKSYLSVLSKYIKNAESSQKSFIFKNLSNCADLIILFNNFTEIFLKYYLKAWAGSFGYEASFSSIQTVKTILSKKPQMFEFILKLMYINYLEVAKANSWQSLKKIKDLQEDIINILSFNLQKAYMTIFLFIRKLCIQLRITINEKRSASIKNIYNWQFINSLILWTTAVCKYSKEAGSDIKLLAYPLIQTIIGVIRLNLVDVFFPLRIILVNLLNKISFETDIFIPCENYLLEILDSSNFSRKFASKILNEADNNNNNEKKKEKFDLNINLKIKKEYYNNYGNVVYLLDEALDSLIEFSGVNCYKISFPEIGHAINNFLRKISKNIMVRYYNFNAFTNLV